MLNGRPALIVEEEFLIALDIQRMLESVGVGQVLLARNTDEARQLSDHWSAMAIAIIEARAGDTLRQALWMEIEAGGTPVILTTSDAIAPHMIANSPPLLRKPISEEGLVSAVATALTTRS